MNTFTEAERGHDWYLFVSSQLPWGHDFCGTDYITDDVTMTCGDVFFDSTLQYLLIKSNRLITQRLLSLVAPLLFPLHETESEAELEEKQKRN